MSLSTLPAAQEGGKDIGLVQERLVENLLCVFSCAVRRTRFNLIGANAIRERVDDVAADESLDDRHEELRAELDADVITGGL